MTDGLLGPFIPRRCIPPSSVKAGLMIPEPSLMVSFRSSCIDMCRLIQCVCVGGGGGGGGGGGFGKKEEKNSICNFIYSMSEITGALRNKVTTFNQTEVCSTYWMKRVWRKLLPSTKSVDDLVRSRTAGFKPVLHFKASDRIKKKKTVVNSPILANDRCRRLLSTSAKWVLENTQSAPRL